MPNCPVCTSELENEVYENLPVLGCAKCNGYLVYDPRVEGMKRARKLTTEELVRQARDHRSADTTRRIRCPKCQLEMAKERVTRPFPFHIDRCQACQLTWFDGGELAAVQLIHEAGVKGSEAQELQRRLAELPPDLRRRLDERIDKLPNRSVAFDALVRSILGPGGFY